VITQRPAMLVQADILIAIKLPTSQDRDAVAALIEGQTNRQEGEGILGHPPGLPRGEGYL